MTTKPYVFQDVYDEVVAERDEAVARANRLELEVQRLKALLSESLDFADHDSWRCAHPPHYYLTDESAHGDRCPCGLDDFEAKAREALSEAGGTEGHGT